MQSNLSKVKRMSNIIVSRLHLRSLAFPLCSSSGQANLGISEEWVEGKKTEKAPRKNRPVSDVNPPRKPIDRM